MKNYGVLITFVDNKIVAFREVTFENESDLERLVDEFDHKCTVEFGYECFVGFVPALYVTNMYYSLLALTSVENK
jgi:hypothetical protein